LYSGYPGDVICLGISTERREEEAAFRDYEDDFH